MEMVKCECMPVGIVICNYNKREYVVNCIQSVLESDMEKYKIYVVDNASEDDSVSVIQERFAEHISPAEAKNPGIVLLQNKENMGGSGGFNRGIRAALDAGHPYIMCLDNDVLVDEAAVRTLYEYMERHKDVGMLGSRVYHMEEPDYIQQFGLNIDFEHYIVETIGANVYEDGTLPELVECDTVATCSVMVRAEAVQKAGVMPEDNFIYWDDMEWGYRIKCAGYRVAAYGASKVLHTKGAGNRNNAVFINYYNVRNRIHFFQKCIGEEQLQDFARQMLDAVFDSLYECMYREEHCSAAAIRFAMDDAMYGVRGRADAYKLQNEDKVYHKLDHIFEHKKTYSIEENQCDELAQYIRAYVHSNYPGMEETEPQKSEVKIALCDYIMKIKDFSMEKIYVDEYHNVFSDCGEAKMIQNYSYSRALFIYMNQKLFVENMRKLRSQTVAV